MTRNDLMTTLVQVDDSEPCTLAEFFDMNDFDLRERVEIIEALQARGVYEGGGGAAAEFTVNLMGC